MCTFGQKIAISSCAVVVFEVGNVLDLGAVFWKQKAGRRTEQFVAVLSRFWNSSCLHCC